MAFIHQSISLTQVAFLLVLYFAISSSSDLCPKEKNWYDANTGKCRPCQPCGVKALELGPCSEFRNTICVDLAIFRFDFSHPPEIVPANKNHELTHRWHEMETRDDNKPMEMKSVNEQPTKIERDNTREVAFLAIAVGTAIILLAVLGLITYRNSGRLCSRNEDRKIASRARLFSRDRLSTTEYMNNLATLDRRLAMDEILEKRKKAIFEPQLLNEANIYTDDVFIDISGIPRHYDCLRNEENEEEPTRSLLVINERR